MARRHEASRGLLWTWRHRVRRGEGRRGDLVKILRHDGLGTSLYAKRLERGRLVRPQAKEGVASLSPATLSMLLEGIDWRNPQRTWRPEMVG